MSQLCRDSCHGKTVTIYAIITTRRKQLEARGQARATCTSKPSQAWLCLHCAAVNVDSSLRCGVVFLFLFHAVSQVHRKVDLPRMF